MPRKPGVVKSYLGRSTREIGILLPNNQHQHRTLHIQKDVLPHIQKDVLPYALCWLLSPVSAALASIFRMKSISTSYKVTAKGYQETRFERGAHPAETSSFSLE